MKSSADWHWSAMFFRAVQKARQYAGTRPNSLKASTWAWYMAMEAREQGKLSVTLAAIDRSRKRDGYIGRGAIARYEEEVLGPMVIGCEREKARKRLNEQCQIDATVERLLKGSGDQA